MSAKSRREQIEAMLADEPNDPELRYMLAMEHASAGDDASAVRVFQELLAVVPSFPPAYHMLGRTLQRLNRNAEARDVLLQGIPVAQKQGNLHAAGEMTELLDSLESV